MSTAPDGHGRFVHFEHGSIYWTPETGAHEVHGGIRQRWAELGWERSFLGYPTSDELPTADGDGRYNEFQGGRITWTRGGGAKEEHPSSFRPRLVTAVGTATIVDHEDFGSNEVLTVPIKVAQTVRSMNTPQQFMRFEKGHGGEVRLEVDLDVRIDFDNSAVVSGEARLYEGTSESTNDLEDRRPISIIVPPNQLGGLSEGTSNSITGNFFGYEVDFSDKGEVNLTFSNAIA